MSKNRNKKTAKKRHVPRPPFNPRPRKVTRLEDGTIGYEMSPDRRDDCLRVAMATVLQVPPKEIPDPMLDRHLQAGRDPQAVVAQSWAMFDQWLSERGLRFVFHETVPIADDRWIGVCGGVTNALQRHLAAEFVKAGAPRSVRRSIEQARPVDIATSSHCVVMSRNELIFDPAQHLKPPTPSLAPRVWEASDVKWGIAFEPINERSG